MLSEPKLNVTLSMPCQKTSLSLEVHVMQEWSRRELRMAEKSPGSAVPTPVLEEILRCFGILAFFWIRRGSSYTLLDSRCRLVAVIDTQDFCF